jgi:hypothetical protein
MIRHRLRHHQQQDNQLELMLQQRLAALKNY